MKSVSAFTTSVALFLSAQISLVQAEILVKEGEKISFLGDSITAAGFSNAGGDVKLIGAIDNSSDTIPATAPAPANSFPSSTADYVKNPSALAFIRVNSRLEKSLA